MPRGDGTGPMGNGPRTGWGAGSCSVNPGPDNVPRIPGRGFGRGLRRGRGFGGGMVWGRRARRGGYEERSFLEDQKETLRSRLNDVNERLDELTAQETQEK